MIRLPLVRATLLGAFLMALLQAAPALAAAPAEALDSEDLANTSEWRPERRGMYLGLDLAYAVGQLHGSYGAKTNTLPMFFGINLRPGYCLKPWVHLGIDWDMKFLITGNGTKKFNAPMLLMPALTFFPTHGLYLRGTGGFDPFDLSPAAGAGLGYEFGVGAFAGVGVGLSFQQIWRKEKGVSGMNGWQIYGIAIQFASYDTLRGFFESEAEHLD